MTRHTSFGGRIETPDEFHRVLRELLLTAHANDVEVSGGWECRSNGDVPDWEIVVTTLADRSSAQPTDET